MSPSALRALAGLAALTSAGAQAQVASYCDDRIAAHAFYGNPQNNGFSTTVVFYVRLQNLTNEPIRYAVRFFHVDAQSFQNGGTVAVLPPWQPTTLRLGQQVVEDPNGPDALSPSDPDEGVARYTRVSCLP